MGACSICRDPRRDVIEAAMATGLSVRVLGERFGYSKSAIHRHRTRHLGLALAPDPAPQVGQVEPNLAVLKAEAWGNLIERQFELNMARTEKLYAKAEKVLERALRRRDSRTAIAAMKMLTAFLGEWRNAIELQAKLAGQLGDGGTRITNTLLIAGEAGNAVVDKVAALIARAQGEVPALSAELVPPGNSAALDSEMPAKVVRAEVVL